jgi:hypothetical protein
MIRVPVLVFLAIVTVDAPVYLWLMYVFAWRTRSGRVPDLHEPSAQPWEHLARSVVVPYRRNERESDCEVCGRPRPQDGGDAVEGCGDRP